MLKLFPRLLVVLPVFGLTACNNDDDTVVIVDPVPKSVTVDFSATVNGEPFECGKTYKGVGSAVTNEFRIVDSRYYLHDVMMKNANGDEAPLTLVQDGVWQLDNIVLLDFENGCVNGTAETNTQVKGTLNAGVDPAEYDTLCFNLGLPFDKNHVDPTTAASPLNSTGMLWSWTAGRKFIRVDGVGDPDGLNQSYNLHLGSRGCVDKDKNGSEPDSECQFSNVSKICLNNFQADKQKVQIDIGAVLKDSNIALNTPDTAPGCMSGNNDPECINIIPKLGLDFTYNDGVNPPSVYKGTGQQLFSTVAK